LNRFDALILKIKKILIIKSTLTNNNNHNSKLEVLKKTAIIFCFENKHELLNIKMMTQWLMIF
jgi:hypothetical protein